MVADPPRYTNYERRKEMTNNYPLSFPSHQPRTRPQDRKRATFIKRRTPYFGSSSSGKHTVAESAKELKAELKRMGADSMIISSNLKVKLDGIPYSGQKNPDDPGVAVYFNWKNKPYVFACDKFTTVEDNLWAIVKHIDAMRGQDRWGVGSLEQAFTGYMALPDPNAKTWWEELNLPQTATLEDVAQAYRSMALIYHPDNPKTGDPEIFIRIQKAYEEAIDLLSPNKP